MQQHLNKHWLIYLLIVLGLFWGAILASIYRYYFPTINDEALSFFKYKNTIPAKENQSFALIGFNAPPDIIDIHQYGVDQVKRANAQFVNPITNKIDNNYDLIEEEQVLDTEFEIPKLTCWLYLPIKRKDPCYSEAELLNLLSKNRAFLQRIKIMRSYKKYYAPFYTGKNGTKRINVQKLWISGVNRKLIKGNKDVLGEVIEEIKHKQELIQQPTNSITKAIHLVLYGLALGALEQALSEYPTTALLFANELKKLNRENAPNKIDFAQLAKIEFETVNIAYCIGQFDSVLEPSLCFNRHLKIESPNFIINNFYSLNKKLENHSRLPDSANDLELCSSLKKKHDKESPYLQSLLHLPIQKSFSVYDELKGLYLKSCELALNNKTKNARIARINALVETLENVKESKDIQDFLNTKTVKDPLTKLPFIYNPKKQTLEFPFSINKELPNLPIIKIKLN